MGMNHSDLLKKIANINKCFVKNNISSNEFWLEGKYIDLQNKKRKECQVTLQGIETIVDSISNKFQRQKLVEFYNLHSSKKILLIDNLEYCFLDKLKEFMNGIGISVELQKQCLSGKYRLDAYIQKYNLAIEYDGDYHKQYAQKIRDIQRQDDIQKALKCRFIRLDSNYADEYNLGIVVKEIKVSEE